MAAPRGQRAEYEVTELVDAQFLEAVLFEAETRRHAALAGDAAAKGDAIEVALEIVTPGMVDAGQVVGMAASLQADEVAAMSAAVNHRVDLAVVPAGDDDRRLPEKRRQVVAGLRQLAAECEVLPGGPEKDAVKLGAIDVGIGEHPVRHACVAFGRPFDFDFLLHNRSSFRQSKTPCGSIPRLSRQSRLLSQNDALVRASRPQSTRRAAPPKRASGSRH